LFLPFSFRILAITVAANRMRTSRTKANANARQQVIKNHKYDNRNRDTKRILNKSIFIYKTKGEIRGYKKRRQQK